jgi:hypothetical protein
MKKTKLVTIILLSFFAVGFLAAIQLPQAKAYSTETTGLSIYGFDNSQQTYASVGGFNIFAFDNKLVFYDNNAVLAKTYTLSALAYSSNCSRTAILAVNSSVILIAQVGGEYVAGYPYYVYTAYNIGLLDVNTLGYTSVISSSQHVYDGNQYSYINQGLAGSGLILMKNTNSTGSFFYVWFSAEIIEKGAWPNNQDTDISNNYFAYVGKVLTNQNWVSGFSIKQSSTSNCWLFTNGLAVTQGMPINTGFVVCSNTFQSGNRADIYIVDFLANSVVYIGVTSLDFSYTGGYVDGSAYFPGMVYLMGVGAYSNKVEVNIAYSYETGNQLGIGTLIFNTTYVSQNWVSIGALSSNSYNIRPFTAGMPTSGGNVSGVYSIGYWDDIMTPWTLTGWSATLSGLEVGLPTWSTYQFGFEFTPQQPQTWPYSTSWDWGGFQPIGAPIGVFVDMVRYLKCEAGTFYAVNAPIAFYGILNGGIFNNATISTAPTEITLQQNTAYSFTGNVYVNSFLTGDGDYSVGITPLSTSASSAFSSFPSSYSTYSFTGGIFSFTIAPRSASSAVYQTLVVNFTLSTGESYLATYDFGFYGTGQGGNNGTPYPSAPAPTDISGVTNWATSSLITLFVPLFILGIFPLAGALYAGFAGMFIGWNGAGLIVSLTGIGPFYVIVIVVLTDIVALYMRPQIESTIFHRKGGT